MKFGNPIAWQRTAGLLVAGSALLAIAFGLPEHSGAAPQHRSATLPDAITAERCQALATTALAQSPVDGLSLDQGRWHDAGLVLNDRGAATAPLPAHCEIAGHYAAHAGTVGGPYSTGFRMRLPARWNGRYFFQGGGGSNGVVGDATGPNGAGNPTALERGYAVIAQDSGHDNARNLVADHGGSLVFGFDPQARADYGYASLKPTYDLGLYLVRKAYGRDATRKIFWGCSKGGQEGMAFAQRYPDAFDGIVAMAPGFALPRAAIAEAWDTRQFANLIAARGQSPTISALKSVLAPAQWSLVAQAIVAGCDALDGARDGIIGAVGRCTNAQVLPQLTKRECRAGESGACLAADQVAALVAVMAGPRDGAGKALYASWPWDAGVGAIGWRVWKTGIDNGPPALNVALGAGSLAAVFTTLPTALGTDPDRLLAWQLAFDMDRDAPKIYAVVPPFTHSAWFDVGMHATDLAAFRAHGGKLIVPHGMSDPVFSAYDTIAWWNEVDARNRGRAGAFVRVFPVPGMNHCGGGPATDRFDSLGALETWVFRSTPPASIPAHAGPDTPWPGRRRPLCPYPRELAFAGNRFGCQLPDGAR